jgi:hypothetical protein
MKLNTPTAIFLGLALIAVAIFFRQPSISEAQAQLLGNQIKDTVEGTVHKIAICNANGTACASIYNSPAMAEGQLLGILNRGH